MTTLGASLRQQFRQNSLACLSIVIALSSLFYNTWRNETSEANRTQRVAAFEILKTMGDLQVIVDQLHYRKENKSIDSNQALGRVLYARDLAVLLPPSITSQTEELLAAWRQHGERLESPQRDNEAIAVISERILATRNTALAVLRELH